MEAIYQPPPVGPFSRLRDGKAASVHAFVVLIDDFDWSINPKIISPLFVLEDLAAAFQKKYIAGPAMQLNA